MQGSQTLLTAAAMCLSFTGCGTGIGVSSPSRTENPAAYTTVVVGQVPPSAFQATTDCVMDGIDTNRLWLDGTARQQRRAEGYRIEELFTQGVMTSVDVGESGEVKYSEWTSATSLVSTKKQLAAVRKCVERFGVARK
jgi:hypothetical protein